MRIGTIQLLPECDEFDAEVFSFLNHQEPLEFSSSPPGGLLRPVCIPAMSTVSLDTYNLRPIMPIQPQNVMESRRGSGKQRKSRRMIQKEKKETKEGKGTKQEGETMAGGDCGEKLREKLGLDEARTVSTETTKAMHETKVCKKTSKQSSWEHIPDSILVAMSQKAMTEFTFARCPSVSSSLTSWTSDSSLTHVSSLTSVWSSETSLTSVSSMTSVNSSDSKFSVLDGIKPAVDKKTTSIFARLRRFARRAAKRFIS